MRRIDECLYFREDISPFLVHLTRQATDGTHPRDVLKRIIGVPDHGNQHGCLKCGPYPVSDVRFGVHYNEFDDATRLRFFGAICFSETPLREVHALIDIENRLVNLSSYGLVFVKSNLQGKGVAPVWYVNNVPGDMESVLHDLGVWAKTAPSAAARTLPLIAIVGRKVTAPGAAPQTGSVDFSWERGWRFPAARGDLLFSGEDVFAGLCPHDEIAEFERLFPPVPFVDPRHNMRQYAQKLIESRERFDFLHSVV
jgi:hypothetical protein